MTNPFKAGTIAAKVFDMAIKGTTRDAINKLAIANEVGGPRLFHILRSGQLMRSAAETTWKYNQTDEGRVTVTNGKSKVAKAAKPGATAKPATKATAPAVVSKKAIVAKKKAVEPAAQLVAA